MLIFYKSIDRRERDPCVGGEKKTHKRSQRWYLSDINNFWLSCCLANILHLDLFLLLYLINDYFIFRVQTVYFKKRKTIVRYVLDLVGKSFVSFYLEKDIFVHITVTNVTSCFDCFWSVLLKPGSYSPRQIRLNF
jgi:hypothetical protein